MKDISVRVTPDNDFGCRAFLVIRSTSTLSTEIELNATSIEDIIESLSQARIQIRPEVSFDSTLFPKGRGVVDPIWSLEMSDVPTYMSLAIRHPGKGWINNLWSKQNLNKLYNSIRLVLSESNARHS